MPNILPFAVAIVLFVLFFINIIIGRFTGVLIIGDVGEALMLFAVAIAFTIGILIAERRAVRK